MLPDYYHILGVPPTAELETIRKAFRQQVVASHPDGGGSHERMVLVNEAWAILSDPETRSRYDQVRQAQASAQAPEDAEAIRAAARGQTKSDPSHSSELENWLAKVAAESPSAKNCRFDGGKDTLSTTNSRSAQAFMWSGAVITTVLFVVLAFRDGMPAGAGIRSILMSIALVAYGGSWLGYLIHWMFGPWSQPSREQHRASAARPSDSSLGDVVIRCPHCGQGLRLPKASQSLAVTCPRCKQTFDLPPSFI